MFKYRMSVIVPVYNCEDYLASCLDSLLRQTISKDELEVLLIDDGSKDGSLGICKEYAEKYDIFKVFSLENGGVSATRNFGIEHSQGQYITYLDSDDTLTDNTLKTVADFFDKHFDEIDLVTYKIVPYYGEQKFALHYRYKLLKKTGVYDLEDPEYCYITQTTMNICVKNLGEGKNVLFDTSLAFHEDQKYCFDVLSDKLKIGFCSRPEYLYLRRPGSTTGKKGYAYYIFENTMAMWEEMFGRYEGHVPSYLQSLYINDINWKSTQDILLPYSYPKDEFDRAVGRINALLDRVDDSVILNHPYMDLYHKHFLLKIKGCNKLSVAADKKNLRVLYDGEEVYSADKVPIVVNSFKVFGETLHVDAFLKCIIFDYVEKPRVFIIKDGAREEIELTHSNYEYYRAGIKTATFWRMRFDIDVTKTKRFELEVETCGNTYKLSYYFGPHVPLTQDKGQKIFFRDGRRYKEKNGVFTISSSPALNNAFYKLLVAFYNMLYFGFKNPRIVYNRLLALTFKSSGPIWLYLDRYGVFDNAYDQFKHDFSKKDGVKRYYILNDCDRDKLDERFTPEEKKNVVMFHSKLHKQLYFNCDKIITSFSNLSNVSPFGAGPTRWYADLVKFELVYLQHGILHASLRSLYDKEHCSIDRVVVSSGFEIENFQKNYGFAERELIKSCMPRYDSMEPSGKKKNRIVFSPSWRSNLIGALVNNEREELPEVFMESDFFKQVSAFLNSERLHDMLEKNDLYLDFKNHPIFKCYNHLFDIKNDRVCTDNFDTNIDEYRLMITDYSSIVFDSVYLNCPVLYFVPDYELFLAGVSHNYRQLDLPLENGFGPFSQDADTLLDHLEEYINNGFVPQEPYASRMKDFFLYRDDHCCDRLYDAMIND